MPNLESVLARIPGYGGYLAKQQYNRQQDMGDLQQAESLMALQQKILGAQREQAFRQALSGLGPNPTQESLASMSARFASPADILKSQTSSLDRKASIEAAMINRGTALEQARSMQTERLQQQAELASQRSEDMRLSQADRNQARMDMIRLAASLKGEAGAKPPSGYRSTAEGNLEAIPGGPADTKIQGQLNQDTAALNSSQAGLDRMQLEAERLLKHPGLEKTTGIMSVVPLAGGLASVPGTDAANFKAGLENLKSQSGLAVLQEMRNNSKTGGALGQVSDFENKMLQANLATLDRAQSKSEFKAALEKIITYTESAKGRLRNAYNMKHQGKPPATPSAASPIDALLEKYK